MGLIMLIEVRDITIQSLLNISNSIRTASFIDDGKILTDT